MLGVAALALSCSNAPKLLDDGSLQLLVDEAGGTLTTESGAGLVIPPGALDGDVALSILASVDVVADGAAALPDFVGGDGVAGVVLKPHGVRFAEPVTGVDPHRPHGDGGRVDVPRRRGWQHLEVGGAAKDRLVFAQSAEFVPPRRPAPPLAATPSICRSSSTARALR